MPSLKHLSSQFRFGVLLERVSRRRPGKPFAQLLFLAGLLSLPVHLAAAELLNTPDFERFFSSVKSTSLPGTGHARSQLHSSKAWTPAYSDAHQWIELPVAANQRVVAIHTQGRKDANRWVKKYRVQARMPDGRLIFLNHGEPLTGNSNRSTVVSHDLHVPFGAVGIRILPYSWKRGISLRAALEVESVECSVENLIYNGSFETHDDLNRGSWGILSELPGWQLDDGQFEIQAGTTSGIAAAHGQKKLELDAYRNSSVSAVVETAPGGHYELQPACENQRYRHQ